MYRRTNKYAKRREWHPRLDVAQEDQRAVHWRPPQLRRRIVIKDFDGTEPVTHVIELFRTSRIDSYHAVIDGREWNPRIGWSRVLDGLRRALPRLASTRHSEA